MMAVLLPRAYLLNSKTVAPNGQSARLIVSGASTVNPDGRLETLYGTIRMELENGEWKVGNMDWSNTRPAAFTQAKPAAAAPAASKAAPAVRSGTAVGTQVERKLGPAKPPCVYKPVMTAEDVENCR